MFNILNFKVFLKFKIFVLVPGTDFYFFLLFYKKVHQYDPAPLALCLPRCCCLLITLFVISLLIFSYVATDMIVQVYSLNPNAMNYSNTTYEYMNIENGTWEKYSENEIVTGVWAVQAAQVTGSLGGMEMSWSALLWFWISIWVTVFVVGVVLPKLRCHQCIFPFLCCTLTYSKTKYPGASYAPNQFQAIFVRNKKRKCCSCTSFFATMKGFYYFGFQKMFKLLFFKQNICQYTTYEIREQNDFFNNIELFTITIVYVGFFCVIFLPIFSICYRNYIYFSNALLDNGAGIRQATRQIMTQAATTAMTHSIQEMVTNGTGTVVVDVPPPVVVMNQMNDSFPYVSIFFLFVFLAVCIPCWIPFMDSPHHDPKYVIRQIVFGACGMGALTIPIIFMVVYAVDVGAVVFPFVIPILVVYGPVLLLTLVAVAIKCKELIELNRTFRSDTDALCYIYVPMVVVVGLLVGCIVTGVVLHDQSIRQWNAVGKVLNVANRTLTVPDTIIPATRLWLVPVFLTGIFLIGCGTVRKIIR